MSDPTKEMKDALAVRKVMKQLVEMFSEDDIPETVAGAACLEIAIRLAAKGGVQRKQLVSVVVDTFDKAVQEGN
jgi:hypothetical protein